jgi:hypothetical protein
LRKTREAVDFVWGEAKPVKAAGGGRGGPVPDDRENSRVKKCESGSSRGFSVSAGSVYADR